MDAPDPTNPILVHFYRATVQHADVWRQRMDATTNWAAATTAAMITFSFSRPDTPHFVLLLALGFDIMFLLMESRRYQAYDRWRRQFHSLNRYLIAPALQGSRTIPEHGFDGVVFELSRTVPHLTLWEAVGYRVRRNYGYLFGVIVLSWLLKLQVHPAPADDFLADALGRAGVGLAGPEIILGLVAVFAATVLVLGLAAPSERMMDWAEVGSPWGRLASGKWMGRRGES
ncbi:MAG: DUF2270 domain-containing protein [Gemmatimonadota bacterium]